MFPVIIKKSVTLLQLPTFANLFDFSHLFSINIFWLKDQEKQQAASALSL